ncbi:MAG: cysteine desulfurase [Neisseriaceae bacterium]|nr:cysteine desulfurase [Neisseriaceae bacterium]
MYLDNHASTPTDSKIIDLFQSITKNPLISNPHSSEHQYGWQAEAIVAEALDSISLYLNCLPDELVVTSGATEANNLAIIGMAMSARLKNNSRNKIIVSAIEHKCVLNAAQHVHELFGFEIIEAPMTPGGLISMTSLASLVDEETLLVSCMAVNNEIGTVQPIAEIGHLCRTVGATFHVDAAQAAYTDIDVVEQNVDLLSLSGHKVYAHKGVGILYINSDMLLKPTPIIHGGGQQGGMRSGTLSPALCASMAKGLELIDEYKAEEINHLQSLRTLFLVTLDKAQVRYTINGSMSQRHPGNLNLQLHGVDASTLIMRLQPRLAISTGSACNSGVIQGSYVLKALGLTAEEISQSIRLGFGRFNTEDEAVSAANMIVDEINHII